MSTPNPSSTEPEVVWPMQLEVNGAANAIQEARMAAYEKRPVNTTFMRAQVRSFDRYLAKLEAGWRGSWGQHLEEEKK